MLEPDSRVVLIDQLRPPPGYRLRAGVATTFTLDLTTAVVPPLAFASFEVRGTPDPIAALEAVRTCTERVDIFCQSGQIVVPAQHSDLMAYLEPMVHPVRRPRPGFLFHPKIWFLEYVADDRPNLVRLLCGTRNLTQSGAWDAVVTLNGVLGTKPKSGNRPLVQLMKNLPMLTVRRLPDDRRARVEAVADRARYVEWELPELVDDISFHTFGVRGVKASPDFSGYRHLIVSPFCDDVGVGLIRGRNSGEVTLVSRTETLDHLALETLTGVKTRILDPLAALGNADDESANDVTNRSALASTPVAEIDTLSGLHAKITVVERARRGHLFVGSPNATSAGYHGNVEFAVELSAGATKLGVDRFLGADAGFAELLMEYPVTGGATPDPLEDILDRIRNALRTLAEVPLTLTVRGAVNGYDLRLQSNQPMRVPAGCELQAELLTSPGHVRRLTGDQLADATFPGITLPDITPFVVLRVRDAEHSTSTEQIEVSSVVHAALINDPPNRLDEVLARQVDTPEKFLRFLALLLGLTDPTSFLTGASSESGDSVWGSGAGSGVFELVVNALASNTQSLRDLDKLVQRLQSTESGRRVLPDGFETLWKSVCEAMLQLEVSRS